MRIQAVLDARSGELRLNLLNMREDGEAGAEVRVSGDGSLTLPGFAGSPLTDLEVTVNDYAGLEDMIRTVYTGRVVDILDISRN